MTTSYLQLTAQDSIVARDGRPFGIDQGNRMKGLGWPYPSVVAGSFRTALAKSAGADFTSGIPRQLLGISVAGVFPVADGTLYLPAPNDCVVHPKNGPLRTYPQDQGEGGCDLPVNGLKPVMLAEKQVESDFEPKESPAWWPAEKLADWLAKKSVAFDCTFLSAAKSQIRDHVQLEPVTGAAAESRLFATAGLNLTHLPRFGVKEGRFMERYACITLSMRVDAAGWNVSTLNVLHPLGGERRLVHWQANGSADLWKCPTRVMEALPLANGIRMVLTTPAIFEHGWRPGWIHQDTLIGSPPDCPVKLKLVGVCIARWKAVSGWSLQPQDDADHPGKRIRPGPKPIKRLVPAGGVYFFEKVDHAAPLAERWLQSVSDDPQDRNPDTCRCRPRDGVH
jgi:CRISPR-associated protein Cmr3